MSNLEGVAKTVELIREDILKGCQYFSILITWLHERNRDLPQQHRWFALYQKLFHSRRLFRVMSFIVEAPRIRQLSLELQKKFSLKSTFQLLGTHRLNQGTSSSRCSCSSTTPR